MKFIDDEYATRAQEVFEGLNVSSLTLHNIWFIFQVMLPYVNK